MSTLRDYCKSPHTRDWIERRVEEGFGVGSLQEALPALLTLLSGTT